MLDTTIFCLDSPNNGATGPGRQAPRQQPPGNNGTSDKEHRSHRPSYRSGLLGLHFDSSFDSSTYMIDNDWVYTQAQRGYNSALLNYCNLTDRDFYLKVAPSTAHKTQHSASSLLSKIRPIFSLSFDSHRRVPSQLHPDLSDGYLKEKILNGYYAFKALKSGSRRVQEAVLIANRTLNHRCDSSISSVEGRLNTRSCLEIRIPCLRGGRLYRHDSVFSDVERSDSDEDMPDYPFSENTFSDRQNPSISDEANPETASEAFTRVQQRRNLDVDTSKGSSRRTISSSRKRARSSHLEHETDADLCERPWKWQRVAAHHPREAFCPEHATLNPDRNPDISTNTPDLDTSNKTRRTKRRVKREYEFWPGEETREARERNGDISKHNCDDQDESETDSDQEEDFVWLENSMSYDYENQRCVYGHWDRVREKGKKVWKWVPRQ
ncbi:hypothetical protein BCR34DRAFT_596229 [Clohesyomyces aquaticus]|uniref:Uncharacterized protein n=1 Tax=Clohesyomyces aquaticus TaxID=1231657 RepID=A0A1Y2A8B8_9PLEO|nr:hypothetical protein BCR34DRAFT_596229 [Clohesyomyces aquaticus]